MELYKEILTKALSDEKMILIFPELNADAAQIVESACYIALQKIKTIIVNDSLSDAECFMQIEEIVRTLEDIGSTSGGRHDFG